MSATLFNLDRLWTIAVGPYHRRLLGGVDGYRFATDGGAMVLITNEEFHEAGSPWSRPPGLAVDHWAERSVMDNPDVHRLAHPAELMTLDHRLGARYGATWISTLYVDLFLRLGGTELLATSDPFGHVVIPGVGVVMPLDPARETDEAGPS